MVLLPTCLNGSGRIFLGDQMISTNTKNHVMDRCVRKDSMSCDHRPHDRGDASEVTTIKSILIHMSIIWFSFDAMVLLYLSILIKILMKIVLSFFICELLCVGLHIKTLLFPVDLDFTSGSGYEDHMDHTPWYFMWSSGIVRDNHLMDGK